MLRPKYLLVKEQEPHIWNHLGSGMNTRVDAIVVGGKNVHADGDFTNAGGNPYADFIARWWARATDSLYLPLILR